MAVLRDRPYVRLNFLLVDLGAGFNGGPKEGFPEVSSSGMEVTVSGYRPAIGRVSSVLKFSGLNKSTDVTLERGVIESLSLYNWLRRSAMATRRGSVP